MIFYQQSRDVNYFLRSNESVSRTSYFRVLTLAVIDLLFTLPFGIVNIALAIQGQVAQGPYPFYPGWSSVHTTWNEAYALPYIDDPSKPFTLAGIYFTYWSAPVLAFIIFGLFGLTADARAMYWRGICTMANWIGWRLPSDGDSSSSPLDTMKFGVKTQDTASLDVEPGCVRLLASGSL